uniref:Uncharacterized protein n=1 Tax=Anguilla anguilla TaxID=7936 RepID=A0A0E9TF43_ANGAN
MCKSRTDQPLTINGPKQREKERTTKNKKKLFNTTNR